MTIQDLRRVLWTVFLCGHALVRLQFWTLNHLAYANLVETSWKCIFAGLRFDLASVALVNAPLLALRLLPVERVLKNNRLDMLTWWLFALNGVFLGVELADAEF